MHQRRKVSVCSDTEKNKTEIYNHIDELISNCKWEEAENNLMYLYRAMPNNINNIRLKFAVLYSKKQDFTKSILFLQELIPTHDFHVYTLFIQSLVKLGEKNQAILELARAPLSEQEKQGIQFNYLQENRVSKCNSLEFNFMCSKCNKFLYLVEQKVKCLFCS
ncbi:MAG: hypothetical protein EAX86_05805 [Candidatus Heimdallarchaeota archaeon]|nr:hypothetical protein [Candidatus Heimdallarchaeota archaeon]